MKTEVDKKQKGSEEGRRGARTVFAQTLILNILVSVAKLVCGFMTNTLSMVADGFHSMLDASSNIVGIIGLSISIKPPDSGHPYGHRKFEAIAAIAISFFMFLACFEVASHALQRLIGGGEIPVVGTVSYVVMIATVLINILVTWYERRMAEKLHSSLLRADAQHTLSDVFVSLGVIVAIISAQAKIYVVDLIMSGIIVLAIFRAGYGVITAHMGILVDAAVVDPTLVEKLVTGVPGVRGCHKIRSRGLQDHIFLDLHVQVPGALSVLEGHKIAYLVEDKLIDEIEGLVDVVVHIEEEEESPPPETDGHKHYG